LVIYLILKKVWRVKLQKRILALSIPCILAKMIYLWQQPTHMWHIQIYYYIAHTCLGVTYANAVRLQLWCKPAVHKRPRFYDARNFSANFSRFC